MNSYKDDLTLYHHGIKGQRWGVRRYQNADGSLTSVGKKRYSDDYIASLEKKVSELKTVGNKREARAINKELKAIEREKNKIDKEWARKTVKDLMKQGNERSEKDKAVYKAEVAAIVAADASILASQFVKTYRHSGLTTLTTHPVFNGVDGSVDLGIQRTTYHTRTAKQRFRHALGESVVGAAALAVADAGYLHVEANRRFTKADTAMLNRKMRSMKSPTGRTVSFVESKWYSPTFGGARTRVQVGKKRG